MRRIKAINVVVLAILMALGWSGYAQASALEELITGGLDRHAVL